MTHIESISDKTLEKVVSSCLHLSWEASLEPECRHESSPTDSSLNATVVTIFLVISAILTGKVIEKNVHQQLNFLMLIN